MTNVSTGNSRKANVSKDNRRIASVSKITEGWLV
jgi:hypothetical protein